MTRNRFIGALLLLAIFGVGFTTIIWGPRSFLSSFRYSSINSPVSTNSVSDVTSPVSDIQPEESGGIPSIMPIPNQTKPTEVYSPSNPPVAPPGLDPATVKMNNEALISGSISSTLPKVPPLATPIPSQEIKLIPLQRYASGYIAEVSENALVIETRDTITKKTDKKTIHFTGDTEIFQMIQRDQETFEKELVAFNKHPISSSPPQIFEKKKSSKNVLIVGKYTTMVVDNDMASGDVVTAVNIEVSDLGPPQPL